MATGLSDNDVTCLAVDSSGYLWAGTNYGLNVYDGYGISNYYQHTQKALKANQVIDLVCDAQNRIWVATDSGVTIFNQTRKLEAVQLPRNLTSVFKILQVPKQGMVVVGNQCYFLPQGQSPFITTNWQPLPWCNAWNNPAIIKEIEPDRGSVFWVTTLKKLMLVDFAKQQIVTSIPLQFGRSSCRVNDTVLATLNYRGAVLLYHIQTGKLLATYYCRSSDKGTFILNNLYCIRLAANGELLITSANAGLFRLDVATGLLTHEAHNANDPSSIGSNYTRQLLCLPNGHVLIGSQTHGLDIANIGQKQSNTKTIFTNQKNEQYDGFINGIVSNKKGLLWLGGQTELIQWNPANNATHFYAFPHKDPQTNSPKKLTIKAVALDSAGRLWVSAYGGGIGYFSAQKNAIVKVPLDSASNPLFRSQFIHQFLVQPNGTIWACSGTGLFSINPNTLAPQNNASHPLLQKTIDGKRVLSLAMDKNNCLWIGTAANGIYCYNQKQQSLRPFTTSEGLASNQCTALCADADGNMYAASPNGLSMIHTNNAVQVFNSYNGLRSNKCQAVIKDADGNMWIANQQYLVRYQPHSSTFTYYDNNAGLTNESFRNAAAFAAADGHLYFGTANGINYFLPNNLGEASTALKINVSAMQTTDSNFGILPNSQFRLAAHQTNITLHFAATDLMGSKNILYQYQLNGHNNHWDTATDIRQITYSALAPGKYTFLLQASKDGLHWQAATPVIFWVATPWFRAWWFLAICMALLAALILIWVKNRERKYHLQQQQKAKEIQYKLDIEKAQSAVQQQQLELTLLQKNLAGAQLTATRAQMNPHFIFNALNSVQQYILQGNVDDANKYLAKFSRLQREILNHCDQQFISLQKEIDMIKLYVEFEQLRLSDPLQFELKIGSGVDADELMLPPMVLQPFIENAIWHGLQPKLSDRKLSILFTLHPLQTYLQCTITDNGIGRRAAEANKMVQQKQPHQSKGLHLVNERLQLLQQQYGGSFKATITDLYQPSNTPAGTKVEVLFYIG